MCVCMYLVCVYGWGVCKDWKSRCGDAGREKCVHSSPRPREPAQVE